ncbi:uncharacterized protein LOC129760215 [Uranotaenia lowii]|uniref:uncharacterized protein LOC129760215 n=1 Tax=Uranotaenia lowii TaxID=190385 RepID=UPI00247AC05B|nr:uncharacterized protein LOC129760215 [Uranotaenia lowii]
MGRNPRTEPKVQIRGDDLQLRQSLHKQRPYHTVQPIVRTVKNNHTTTRTPLCLLDLNPSTGGQQLVWRKPTVKLGKSQEAPSRQRSSFHHTQAAVNAGWSDSTPHPGNRQHLVVRKSEGSAEEEPRQKSTVLLTLRRSVVQRK